MKKIISMVLSFILILGCSTTAFAAETHNYDTENLPHDGADYFETEIKADEENEERISDFVTVYGYQYTKGSLKSGAWRNGTSGGSSTSSAKLSLNYTQDTSYNISFKASVSGGYTNGGTIGSELGVTLGASKSYSLGSGYSVTVPKGSHYLIKYRPMYYTYKVVETKYKERYNTQEDLLENAREFRKRKLPIDMIVQDWQYWGKNKYSNPLLHYLHRNL